MCSSSGVIFQFFCVVCTELHTEACTLIHNLMHEIREQRLDLVTSASVDVNVLVLIVSQSIVSCTKINFCQLYFHLYQVTNISIIS